MKFPVALVVILVLGYAVGGLAGLATAAAVVFVAYWFSVKLNPRVACGKCDGRGRYPGWLFTWVWHWCHMCGGQGRTIRWGSARWGTPAAKAEAVRIRTAAAARPRRR